MWRVILLLALLSLGPVPSRAGSTCKRRVSDMMLGAAGATGILLCFGMLLGIYWKRRSRMKEWFGTNAHGLIVFLFSDIQSSTTLWEAATESMNIAVHLHNGLFRKILAKFDGYEVKSEGDAFMMAFGTCDDAVQYCMEVQEELMNLPWPAPILAHPAATESFAVNKEDVVFRGLRVRMGLHIGYAEGVIDPVSKRMDYYGPVVCKAARVSGVAKGGQIIISQDVHDAIDWTESTCTRLGCVFPKDLGTYPLRGLSEPTRLYQLLPRALSQRKFEEIDVLAPHEVHFPSSPVHTPLARGDLMRGVDLWQVRRRLMEGISFTVGSGLPSPLSQRSGLSSWKARKTTSLDYRIEERPPLPSVVETWIPSISEVAETEEDVPV